MPLRGGSCDVGSSGDEGGGMTDRLEIDNQTDKDFQEDLAKIRWPISYGNIKVQLRNGKLTTVAIEKTIKLD